MKIWLSKLKKKKSSKLPDFVEEDFVANWRSVAQLRPVELVAVAKLEKLLSQNAFLLNGVGDVLVNP